MMTVVIEGLIYIKLAAMRTLNFIRLFFAQSLRAFLVLFLTFSGLLLGVKIDKASAACPDPSPANCVHMLLFWDGGAMPNSDWEDISSTYNGKFPRGDTPANFATTGGTSDHVPTVASVTTSTLTSTTTNSDNSAEMASMAHTHPPASVTVANNSPAAPPSSEGNNIPAYRTLQLMRYKYGIPNVIPAGGIALFDDSPGIPPDGSWTRLSAQDGKVIRIGTTAGTTGGQDTHNYTLTWSSLGAASGTRGAAPFLGTTNFGAAAGHTHNAPAATISTTLTSLPPYVTPLLAKAVNNTPTISVGFSAMFDGDPGGGWVIRSDSSGGVENTTFYHQFLRPNTAWNGTSQGRDNETMPNQTAVTGPANTAVDTLNVGLLGTDGAPTTHTHTLTATFSNSTDVLPPYFGVVIAEKVNFIQDSYKWYQDSGTNDVTNPWSALMPNANTPIVATPMAYNPPDLTDQLRLRMLIDVNGNNLAAGVAKFKLQYREGATDGSCTNGTWTDVDVAGTGTAAWRYGTSAAPGAPVDGDNLTTTKLAADWPQQFVASSDSAYNHSAVSIGQKMEYDFYIQNKAAKGATHYYFRVSETVGTLLSQYDTCPSLITMPQTGDQLRHGLFFVDGTKGAFSWAD